MYSVELYSRVRRACHIDGMNKSAAARLFGIHRKTVAKILEHSVPPGYRRSQPPVRPKLDPFIPIIDQILEDDKSQLKKQRHTAKRIFERLRDEYGFTGGITIMCVSGNAGRVRFSCRWCIRPGMPRWTSARRSGRSAGLFASCTTSRWPCRTRTRCLSRPSPGRRPKLDPFIPIIDQILEDDKSQLKKQRHTAKRIFERLRDEYGFTGGITIVPMPRFESFEALNAWLEEQCLKRQDEVLRGHDETIGQRLLRDLDALMVLPSAPYDACEKISTRATSISMVRYRCNDYSVPVAYAHHEVHVRGYVDEVVIGCGAEEIARHPRSYEKADMVFDPMHFLALLEQKVGALDQAAPLQGWDLPDELTTLRRLLEARMGKKGKREYVQVLRLLETFEMGHVHGAVRQALDLGAIGYDAVKHLVLCRIERRPPRLDLDIYPYLPRAQVETTDPASYMSLMSGVAA